MTSYRFEDKKEQFTSSSADCFTLSEENLFETSGHDEQCEKEQFFKETKRAASMAAVANMLRTKKIMQDQLGDLSREATGDLLRDGAGFLQIILQNLKDAIGVKIKGAIVSVLVAFFGLLVSILSTIAPFIVIIVIVVIVTTSFFSIFTDGIDIPDGDGCTYVSLSDSEIGEIMQNIYMSYPEIKYEQEVLLEYVLSKVGCEYDQNYHWSLTEDIFDCSSLVYRGYLEVGINISNAGIYSAAEECRMVVEGQHFATGELMPGDLIFYGGSDNDRYMGVYHVSVYVGNGKMVEARGTSWGVVYCDVRTTNAVAYGRYL